MQVAESTTKRISRRQRVDRFMNSPLVDITVITLILLSVAAMLVEATQPHGSRLEHLASTTGDILTIIFVIELSLRYYGTDSHRQFWTSYWVDVIAVLPLFRPLRFLRVLRLLRIIRVGLMFNRHISAMSRTFRESVGEITVVLVLLVAVVLVGTVGIGLAESHNPHFRHLGFDFWWSLFSLVGGGPVEGSPVPTSTLGRIFLLSIMISSMTIFAILTGVVSAGMVNSLRHKMMNQKTEIAKLVDHVIICGVNRMVGRIIEELQYLPEYRHKGIVVIAEFDDPPEMPPRTRYPANIFFLQGDYTKLSVLREAGLARASTAILLADKTKPRSDQDRDARTVLAAMLIERERRKQGEDIFTCVELLNPDNMEQLRSMGVEELVVLDEYGGSIIAASSANQGMVPIFNELFTRGWGNAFMKHPLPKELIGKDVRYAIPWVKEHFDALLLAVVKAASVNSPVVNPPLDMRLAQGDQLVLIAPTDVEIQRRK